MKSTLSLVLIALYGVASAADTTSPPLRAITPATKAKTAGPYSPGILAGDFLYISGQGARNADGELPTDTQTQIRQSLDNIKAILHSAGMRLENILHLNVYLTDINAYNDVDSIFAAYFPKAPARTIIGVSRLPGNTPLEISAVAYAGDHDNYTMGSHPFAVRAGNRIYFSGVLGRRGDSQRIPADMAKQAELAFDSLDNIMKQTNVKTSDLSFVTVYHSPAMTQADAERFTAKRLKNVPCAVIETAAIPLRSNIEVQAISAPDLIFTSAQRGDLAKVINDLKAEVNMKGSSIQKVVAVNVYLDAMENFPALNTVYAPFFSAILPSRTTVEATPVSQGKPTTVSMIAVK